METNSQLISEKTSDSDKNPLDSVNVRSIDELMREDPEKLSDDDIKRIVNRLRESRRNFQQQEAQGKKPKATSDTGKTLDLADLGF